MSGILIVCVCAIVILIALLIASSLSDDLKSVILVGGFSIFLNIFFFALIWMLCDIATMAIEEPSAMDVYRGNVELDITYKTNNRGDTISCDSVAVFKKDIPK